MDNYGICGNSGGNNKFAIWNGRIAFAQAIKVSKKIEEREEKVERALIEFVKDEPRLAVALRYACVL